jgi:amphi-Trp domain-containing protein
VRRLGRTAVTIHGESAVFHGEEKGGQAMPKLKFEKKETLSRKEAAARLREIAQALGAGEEVELKRGGEKIEFDVPDEVAFELEIEMEDGETELEIEIKWSSKAPAPAPAKRSS